MDFSELLITNFIESNDSSFKVKTIKSLNVYDGIVIIELTGLRNGFSVFEKQEIDILDLMGFVLNESKKG